MADFVVENIFPCKSTLVSHRWSIKYQTQQNICMQRIELHKNRTRLFIFDLEFIGDVKNLNSCHIWEIAVFSLAKNAWFSKVVDPDKNMDIFPKPPIPEIPQLKRQFLDQEHAVTWDIAFAELCAWVSEENTTIPVFISHNTFRADKPILELECKRYNCRMPSHWHFFDSLHYARDQLRNSGNYSLSGLYSTIFNQPIENAHRAKADVNACVRILAHLTNSQWQLEGPIYPAYVTSLRSIRWIGRKAENTLVNVGINSVETLFMLLQQNIHRDYLHHGIKENISIHNTLTSILTQMPNENIQNITEIIMALRVKAPFSYTFMLTNE